MQETWVQSSGWQESLEREMAIPSSTLAWKMPRTEKSGRQQSTGLQRVLHDWELFFLHFWGFPDSSVDKESTCSEGDPGSIFGLGRSAEEGIGYPLQYSWAFLVAQPVKNLPKMWETWVQSPGWEDPLEKGKATHSSITVWRITWTIQTMEFSRPEFWSG